ncbi:monooxygenase [Geopyxis carbonaria]|nr:monooxygenase [Geopyxis carbonaria]
MPPLPPSAAESPSEHRSVLIVGAGTSGILQACELLRHATRPLPHSEFAILERYPGFGGCWWRNTYPGCACDTPSHVYSVSWWRNPNWTKKFASQPEILAYYERLAAEFKLAQSAHFNTEVVSATWIEKAMLWAVETRDTHTGANRRVWTCRVLITGLGPFSIPKKLDVPGIDSFAGEQWHAGEWPADASVAGKRVAIIGTGPSAAQIIPAIVDDVKSLAVFQRSPAHCWPRNDTSYPAALRWLFSICPWIMALYVSHLLLLQEYFFFHMCRKDNWLQRKAVRTADEHLAAQVADPELRAKLHSKDAFGCKRPLFLDTYYPALQQPHVTLLTAPVTAITPTGVLSRADDGSDTLTPVDTIVWATGYQLSRAGAAFPTYGRGGVLLADAYGEDVSTLYGVANAGFPNLLNFVGPYSVSIWFSIVAVIETTALHNAAVVAHVLDLNRGSFARAVMPRMQRQVEWVKSLRERQAELPTADASCVTYYKTPKGTVIAYPGSPGEYRALLKKVEWRRDWEMVEWRPGMAEVAVGDVPEPGRV